MEYLFEIQFKPSLFIPTDTESGSVKSANWAFLCIAETPINVGIVTQKFIFHSRSTSRLGKSTLKQICKRGQTQALLDILATKSVLKQSASSIKFSEVYVCRFFESLCNGYLLGRAVFQPEY